MLIKNHTIFLFDIKYVSQPVYHTLGKGLIDLLNAELLLVLASAVILRSESMGLMTIFYCLMALGALSNSTHTIVTLAKKYLYNFGSKC
jgi:hypothetical protein